MCTDVIYMHTVYCEILQQECDSMQTPVRNLTRFAPLGQTIRQTAFGHFLRDGSTGQASSTEILSWRTFCHLACRCLGLQVQEATVGMLSQV